MAHNYEKEVLSEMKKIVKAMNLLYVLVREGVKNSETTKEIPSSCPLIDKSTLVFMDHQEEPNGC